LSLSSYADDETQMPSLKMSALYVSERLRSVLNFSISFALSFFGFFAISSSANSPAISSAV